MPKKRNDIPYPDSFTIGVGHLPDNDFIGIYAHSEIVYLIADTCYPDDRSYKHQMYGSNADQREEFTPTEDFWETIWLYNKETAKMADKQRDLEKRLDKECAPDLSDYTLFINQTLPRYEAILAHSLAWEMFGIRYESTEWYKNNPLHRHLIKKAHETVKPDEDLPYYLQDNLYRTNHTVENAYLTTTD